MSLLLISEILAVFVNILTTDHKYPLCNRENLQQSIQMPLSKKQKNLSLLHLWNLHQILNIFKKKMILLAYHFKYSSPVLKSKSNFEDFEKTDEPLSLPNTKITNCETTG